MQILALNGAEDISLRFDICLILNIMLNYFNYE